MIFFGQKIKDLKKGEGFTITKEEWEGTGLKTPLPSYFYAKLNRRGIRVVKVLKTSEGFYIEKIGETSSEINSKT
jgi:hypothetical protein